jgi:phosphatidylglycerol---prolipoprotein diacylglyceryl transferase
VLQTLFHIPEQIAGVPMFGFGLLLAIWAVASIGLLGWLGWRQGFTADTWGYVPVLVIIGAAILWVLPHISEPGEGLPVRGYGVMLLSGVVCGTALSAWRGRRRGVDPEQIVTLIFWGFVPGIIGARLFFVIEYWPQFIKFDAHHVLSLKDTLIALIDMTMGGLVVYGSLIGGLLGMVAYMIKERLRVLATFDIVAPGMLLGLALGRVGCFLNGCCFGGPCDLPWAVTFPAGSLPYVYQVEHGELFAHGIKLAGRDGDLPTIAAVEPGSPAERQGFQPGQRVESVNGHRVASVGEAEEAIEVVRPGTPISISVAGGPSISAVARSEPVHPTQLYSVIDATLLCLFLLAYDPFRRRDGELIALLLTIYPTARFLMEMIRTDEAGILGTGLTIGQLVSLAMLVAAAALWTWLIKTQPRRTVAG